MKKSKAFKSLAISFLIMALPGLLFPIQGIAKQTTARAVIGNCNYFTPSELMNDMNEEVTATVTNITPTTGGLGFVEFELSNGLNIISQDAVEIDQITVGDIFPATPGGTDLIWVVVVVVVVIIICIPKDAN